MALHAPSHATVCGLRFNRRRSPLAAFQTLLRLGSQQQAPTYHDICAVRARPHPVTDP